jgi:hypothetical protein
MLPSVCDNSPRPAKIANTMAQNPVKETDIAVLIAAIQSSVGPIQVGVLQFPKNRRTEADRNYQVDAEKVAKQLNMSLSSIPPKFTAIRKRYNIDIKVVNSGALQRNRQTSPKKRLSTNGPKPMRMGDLNSKPAAQPQSPQMTDLIAPELRYQQQIGVGEPQGS